MYFMRLWYCCLVFMDIIDIWQCLFLCILNINVYLLANKKRNEHCKSLFVLSFWFISTNSFVAIIKLSFIFLNYYYVYKKHRVSCICTYMFTFCVCTSSVCSVSIANYLERIWYIMAQMCYAEETSKNAFPTRGTKLEDKNRICRNASLFQIFLLKVILLLWRFPSGKSILKGSLMRTQGGQEGGKCWVLVWDCDDGSSFIF